MEQNKPSLEKILLKDKTEQSKITLALTKF
jgi:hypothetical protein